MLRLEQDYLWFERLRTPSIAFEVPLEGGCIGIKMRIRDILDIPMFMMLAGFVMKPGKWDDDATDFCLSGVFDTQSMRSSCILRMLTKDDLKRFKERLADVKLCAWYPLFLPAILIEMRIQSLPAVVKRIRLYLRKIGKATGTHKNYLRRLGLTNSKGRNLREVWADPDFETAPAELTSIASDASYWEYACKSELNLLRWVDNMHRRVLEMSGMRSDDPAHRMLQTKMEFMEMWITKVREKSCHFGKQVEGQVQTVRRLMGLQ